MQENESSEISLVVNKGGLRYIALDDASIHEFDDIAGARVQVISREGRISFRVLLPELCEAVWWDADDSYGESLGGTGSTKRIEAEDLQSLVWRMRVALNGKL